MSAAIGCLEPSSKASCKSARVAKNGAEAVPYVIVFSPKTRGGSEGKKPVRPVVLRGHETQIMLVKDQRVLAVHAKFLPVEY